MRAILFDRYGSADVLELREAPLPEPGSGEVRVKVRAAALNPKDSMIRKGKFRWLMGRAFPKGLGYDFAGVVDALGPGAPRELLGAEVFGMKNGFEGSTCAEFTIVPAGELAPKPKDLSFEEAAAVPLVCLTALQALRDEGRVGEGELAGERAGGLERGR